MKYNLSKIMLKAWKIYRKTKGISFGESLHRAWLSAKAEEINAKRIETAKQAAGITEETNTFTKWKELGYKVQHTYELAELFRIACSGNEAFMELSEEDQERFWLITDALMMNDPEDLKRVHNLANYLMVKRIKDNAKVAEA